MPDHMTSCFTYMPMLGTERIFLESIYQFNVVYALTALHDLFLKCLHFSCLSELTLESEPTSDRICDILASGQPATFALTQNLHVRVQLAPINGAPVWCFTSKGLYCVGQEEVCLLLKQTDASETLPPVCALWHFYLLYDLAVGRLSTSSSSQGRLLVD